MNLNLDPFELNPLDRNFINNPYPYYSRLRNEDPIHRSPLGMWIVSRYSDVYSFLRDKRLSSQPSPYSIHSKRNKQRYLSAQVASNLLPFLDPPAHTRLRNLLGKALYPHIKAMNPAIENLVDMLLRKHENTGTIDIIADIASPLPIAVIAELLGIPSEDREKLKDWAHHFFHIFSPGLSNEDIQKLNNAIEDFRCYIIQLIRQRRKQPKDDLITALVQVRDLQDKLTEDELIATCILLFTNGEESIGSLIGNGMLALLEHPEQLEKLKKNPWLIDSAVEEILRFDGSTQLIGRTCIEDLTIENKIIRRGEPIFLAIGSANRDPERFEKPEQFDITRDENQHLGFAGGIHSCLGAPLARIECQIAIKSMICKLPNLKLIIQDLQWKDSIIGHRGLKSLPAEFDMP